MAINTIEQCSQRGRRSPSVLSQQNANRRKARCLKWQKLARKLFYPDFDFWLLRLVAYAFFGPIRCRSVHRRFAKALYSEGYRVRIPPHRSLNQVPEPIGERVKMNGKAKNPIVRYAIFRPFSPTFTALFYK
jgi:hypothetical protein